MTVCFYCHAFTLSWETQASHSSAFNYSYACTLVSEQCEDWRHVPLPPHTERIGACAVCFCFECYVNVKWVTFLTEESPVWSAAGRLCLPRHVFSLSAFFPPLSFLNSFNFKQIQPLLVNILLWGCILSHSCLIFFSFFLLILNSFR